jgi:hypothetical protein
MPYDDAKRYFHRMDMAKILKRIDARIAELRTSRSAVSKKATGSTDTIRNWERRSDDQAAGATIPKLQSVADQLGVPLDWLLGNGADDLEEYLGSNDDLAELIALYHRMTVEQRKQFRQIVSVLAPSRDEEQS